jgi:hypothetical protein
MDRNFKFHHYRIVTANIVDKPLGDIVAAAFASVGITKDRAQAVAELAGLEDCGCERRRQRLNDLGRMVGIGGPPPPSAPENQGSG